MKARLLAAVAVSLLTFVQPAASQQTEKLTFAYSYTVGGYMANFVPMAERFAKEAGLDITLISPASGSDSVKLLASGTAQFAMVNTAQVFIARSRGVPIVSVAAPIQSAPLGMFARAESGIRSIKDLAGKTLGITGIPANEKLLDHVLRVNGVDTTKVRIIEVGYGGIPLLLAGKVDAVEAASFTEPFDLNRALGKPLNDLSTSVFLSYAQNGGHPYYFYNINVTEEYRAKNENTIRKFVKAWRDATEWSMNNPEEAVRIFLKRYPEANPELSLAQWKAVVSLHRSPDTNAHGLGWQNPDVWAKFAGFMIENKLIPVAVAPASAYTNVYLPK